MLAGLISKDVKKPFSCNKVNALNNLALKLCMFSSSLCPSSWSLPTGRAKLLPEAEQETRRRASKADWLSQNPE